MKLVAFATLLFIALLSGHAVAATGINQTVEFQGRLLNSQGATVPDGYYNIEFKIYANGDGKSAGDTTGTPAGTLLWTEDYLNYNSQGVKVVNGFFSVQLGSVTPFGTSVDWNQSTLWLSMNVAGTSTTCTTFSACSPDGEMLPMQPMTSAPYAFNAQLLNGIASSQFVQLGQGVQTDASTNASIFINKTGTGDLLDLQAAGSDAFLVGNNGDLTFGANTTTHNISVTTAAASTAGVALNITAGAAGSGTTALAGGNLSLTAGAGGGTNGNGGNVSIDAGLANGTGINGSVSIGTQNASSVIIGNTKSVTGIAMSVGAGNFSLNGVGASSYSIGSSTTTGTISFGGVSQTGSLALQSQGISESLNGSSTTPSVIVQSSINSTRTLQINNAAGDSILGVDTSGSQAFLGQSNAINGALQFRNSSNTNSITLNTNGAYSSYTLSLPINAPSQGLCLETSSANSSQLVFVSCANNNASITEVQEWDTSASNTLAINPLNVGDEIVLTTSIPTSGVTVSGISGGGVSNWNKVVVSAGNGTVSRVEMWIGTVTVAGASTITVSYSSAPGIEEVSAIEFTAAGVNSATNWGIDASSSQTNTIASTTVTMPNISSTNSDELYVGYAQVQNAPATAGNTVGFNYVVTSIQHNVFAYNLSTSANASYQPTATQALAGESNSIAVMLTAFVSSSAINNSTSLQKANYYVQASTAGSVAGVLQAASAGTGDILDLKNNTGVNVGSFGATGSLTLENSVNSTSAFSVQNSNASSVLGVDTVSGQVNLGSANSIAGNLNFYDTTDSNAITLSAPTAIAASYNLALPSNAPSSGLCLETSPGNANQLVFNSCAQQVAAASISYVTDWSANGTNVSTLAINPVSVGDLLVFYAYDYGSNSSTVSALSGGGVTKWQQITQYGNAGANINMWRGVVTTAGASTVTVSYARQPNNEQLSIMEYTIGSSAGTWDVDASGTDYNTSTTISYPSLTPLNSSELYTGYAIGQATMSPGTTTGYTYVKTSAGNYLAYNLSVNGGQATQPTASQNSKATFYSIAATIAAYNNSSVIADSTATQSANFNVQAAKAGTVAGVLQAASTGTADIFDARNASGNNIASVTTSGLKLGSSQAVGGSLTFADSTDSNTITLASPSSIAASYTLSLPTSTPTANMCLSTSPSSATQLIFTSCASQVSSVPISFVAQWNANGNGITRLNVSPANVGDLMVLFSYPENGTAVQSVTGGGVANWQLVNSDTGAFCGYYGYGNCDQVEMWRGVVTTTGASTVQVTFNPNSGFFGAPGNPNELVASEFTTGSSSSSWSIDNSATLQTTNNSTTLKYPSLTPSDNSDLYVGYGEANYCGAAASSGGTGGYTYITTGLNDMLTYDSSVSGTQAPTANLNTACTSGSVAALIAAFNSRQVIANTASIQEANIYIQAATSGSIAGVFQAASTGTSNVLNILNAAGTVVDSFGSTGNLLIQPSTNSATAFQVQDSSNVNILSVNTANLTVNIGAGATGETTPSLLVLDSETGTSNDPTEVDGAMYYNATSRSFRCGVDGAWQSCNGLMYANASPSASVNNCTTNCAAFSTATAIPANYCQTGRVIKILSDGYYSTGATSSSLQFGVYYGTSATSAASDTLIGTLTPTTTTTSVTNDYFQMDYNLVCFSTSSIEAEGTLNIQTGASTASMTVLPIASTSATTVVTNVANNLYIFPIWSSASTSNTVTVTQMVVSGL